MMLLETGKSVLLTGGTGFVGASLVRALAARSVPVVLLLRSKSDPWRIADLLDDGPAITVCSIDESAPGQVFQRHDVQVVMHLATAYGRRNERLSDLVSANVEFPLTLLQAAIEAGVEAFFNTDTFSCKSGELPDGLAAYVLTKRHFRECAELAVGNRDTRLVNLRIEHVYGPRDGRDKFLPALLQALLADEAAYDLTPGQQVRDFVHIDDVIAAYLTLLERYRDLPEQTVMMDVGTGTGHTLETLVRLARELCGARTELRLGALPYRSGELMHSVADTRPLRALGWMPQVALRDGLARTIEAARA
jgi:nucleoside-diphosphate-sugar epimerase